MLIKIIKNNKKNSLIKFNSFTESVYAYQNLILENAADNYIIILKWKVDTIVLQIHRRVLLLVMT